MTESLELKVLSMIQKAVHRTKHDDLVFKQQLCPEDADTYIHSKVGSIYQRYTFLKHELNRMGLQLYVTQCQRQEDLAK